MKNPHEEKVYEFFTEPENFETMVKVVARADKVSKRLIKEFWDELEKELRKQFPAIEGWVVGYSQLYDARFCKLQVYHKSWTDAKNSRIVSVSFQELHFGERPWVGISINADSTAYKMSAIKHEIESMEKLSEYRRDSNNWWATWKMLSFDLAKYESLTDLIPANRATIIQNQVEEAVYLVDLIKDEVAGIMERNKI